MGASSLSGSPWLTRPPLLTVELVTTPLAAEPFDELLGRSLDELTESAASIFDDDSDFSAGSSKRGASSPPPASVASNYTPRELFAADADAEEEDKRARRRAQIASSSRRQRSRRKVRLS